MLNFTTILSTLKSTDFYGKILPLSLDILLNFLGTKKKISKKNDYGKKHLKKIIRR